MAASAAVERQGGPDAGAPAPADLAALVPRAPGSTEPERERAARLARDAEWAGMLAANFELGDPAGLGYGVPAWHPVARVAVPPNLRRDLVPGAGVPLACYEAGLRYTLDHADHPVALVHGLVVERGRLWPHCWVEVGGEVVYDPTTGELYDLGSFDEVLTPAVLDRFTPAVAAERASAEGTAGPWPASEPAVAGLVVARAVGELLDAYALGRPALVGWVRQMRERDAVFARDLDALSRDLLAVPDLLAALAEHPAVWVRHPPGGARWPWRVRKRPGDAMVLHPAGPQP